MQAVIFIDLSSTVGTVYEQPVLARLKKAIPTAALLDLDAQSDAMLQQYALRLLQEATQAVVILKAGEETAAGFGNSLPVLEQLLTPNPNRLLLLYGTNQRLLRMLQARPQLMYKVIADEEELYRQALQHFA